PDLLVLGTFPAFYRNGEKGFVDVSTSWLEPSPPAGRVLAKNDPVVTAALADVDHDGDLDLILGYAFTPSRLFRNSGNGTFSDVTKAAGLAVDRDGAEVG